MAKKKKENKKKDMPEFKFKEFTDEESRIYEEAIAAFRAAVASGKNLRDAYAGYTIADKDLEKLIQADFLKILIAERHFGQGKSLPDVATSLGVSADLVKETHARMLQEVGISAADQFGKEFGSLEPKTND